jgi:amino acid transporter
MSATTGTNTPTPVTATTKLRQGALSLIETFGQSLAVIAPTLTPALNITVVAATAGIACWLSYFVGTIGVLIVALSVGILASRHAQAGSFFVYAGRCFGPYTGALAGWSMISAYIMTAIAVVEAFPIFVGNLLTAVGIDKPIVPLWVFAFAQIAMIGYAAYRDIKLSSRVGLICECISVGIIIVITAMVIGVHGTVIDPQRFPSSTTARCSRDCRSLFSALSVSKVRPRWPRNPAIRKKAFRSPWFPVRPSPACFSP